MGVFIVQDKEWELFKQKLNDKTGINLNFYKPSQMQRRLTNLMGRYDVKGYMELWNKVEPEPKLFSDFIEYLTINVTEFFRTPEKFTELESKVIPELLQKTPKLNIWSAGCSLGAEPYSLAMILKDLTPGTKHRILATDLDVEILAKAKMGMYSSNEFKNISQHRAQKHFQVRDGKYLVSEDIKNCVEFKRHNLLLDPFEKGFDLILCRNVVIYFTDEAKFELYKRFFDALKPGGVLFVGGTEAILNFREIGFESYLPFFYRKPL